MMTSRDYSRCHFVVSVFFDDDDDDDDDDVGDGGEWRVDSTLIVVWY